MLLSVLGLLLVAAVVTCVLGSSPLWLLLATGVVATLACGQLVPWRLAFPTVVLGLLLGLAVLMQVLPWVPVSVELATTTCLSVVAVAAWLFLAGRRDRLRLLTRDACVFAATVLVVPLVGALAMMVVELWTGGTRIAWIMNKDSPANFMLARVVLVDHGVTPGSNPAPFTAEFLAFFMAPGRSGVAAADLLAHDVQRGLQSLTLLIAGMSALGAVLGAVAVPRRHLVARTVIALGLAGIPWTWFVMGYATQYGFFNALIVGPVLVCIWAAWTESTERPLVGTALQAAGATVLLATWAPLVVISLGLGASGLFRFWKIHLRLRGRRLALWLVPTLVFVWYAYEVTRPLLPSGEPGPGGASTSPLALDGWFFSLPWSAPVVIVAITALVVVMVTSNGGGTGWDLWGLFVLVSTGALAIVYLMGQRAGSPIGPWGYYPQKLSWLLCMLAPYIVVRVIGRQLGTPRSYFGSAGIVCAAALASAVILVQIPPADDRPVSSENQAPKLAPYWSLSSSFPLYSLTQPHGLSEFDPAVAQLLKHSDPSEKTVFAGLLLDGTRDFFVNLWLLQQPVVQGNSGPRTFAFSPDIQSGDVLCNVATAWGGDLTVRTRRVGLRRQVQKVCPTVDVKVRVRRHGPLPVAP